MRRKFWTKTNRLPVSIYLALILGLILLWRLADVPHRTTQAASRSLTVSVFVADLSTPWDMTFTPDGAMLVNQRSGGIKARRSSEALTAVRADFSDLRAVGEGGLMGMVVDPDFGDNRRFYTCQGHEKPREIQVISWTISDDYSQATRVDDPLVGGIPMNSNGRHSGCRLLFGADGYLYVSTGDAAVNTTPQDLASLGGKVLRIDAQTGQGAPDNPYIDSESANSKLIYSYGHRNPQGLALRPGSSQIWAVEHGPHFDDEINLLQKGANYGWDPVAPDPKDSSYYEYGPMTDTQKYPAAVEAEWSSGSSTYATAGGVFLEGSHWGDKEGWLAVATLKNSTLYLFNFSSDGEYQSVSIPPELKRTHNRLRSALIGPDKALYIASNNAVLRVNPTADPPPPADTTPPPIVVDRTGTRLVASTDADDVDQSSWRNLQIAGNQCDQSSFGGDFDQSPNVNLDGLMPGDYAYCFAVQDTNGNWNYDIFEFQIAPLAVDTDESETPDQGHLVVDEGEPNPEEESGESAGDNQAEVGEDEEATLPEVWENLTMAQKIAANPYGCDLDRYPDSMRPDGTCQTPSNSESSGPEGVVDEAAPDDPDTTTPMVEPAETEIKQSPAQTATDSSTPNTSPTPTPEPGPAETNEAPAEGTTSADQSAMEPKTGQTSPWTVAIPIIIVVGLGTTIWLILERRRNKRSGGDNSPAPPPAKH